MKKLKSIYSIFTLSLLLIPFTSCKNKEKVSNTLGLMTTDDYFSDDNFKPVLRFSVCSDVHIGNTRGQLSQIVTKMCNYTYDVAEKSSYKKVDAVLFAGDISDTGSIGGWERFKNELDLALHDETKPMIVMGNHDFRAYTNAEEKFEETFNCEADFHEVINGFHFICLSPSNETSFSNEKVAWLEKELALANADDSTKPIFVMQHMNIANTIVGSKDWGVSELTSTLSKYPQVVDFSGHSHFPMKDPRSIWQGDFTALGCGTMFYYELGLNGYKDDGLFPIDEFGGFSSSASNALSGANYYIVEVDNNNAVRISGIDLLANIKMCEYGIKEPSNKESFIYTNSKKYENSSEPFFEKKHTVNATVNSDSIILEITKAYCKDLIESYRIEVYKDNKKVNTFYTLSCYYLNPMPDSVMVTLTGLESKTKYRIDIYAITALRKSNKNPLSYEITTL